MVPGRPGGADAAPSRTRRQLPQLPQGCGPAVVARLIGSPEPRTRPRPGIPQRTCRTGQLIYQPRDLQTVGDPAAGFVRLRPLAAAAGTSARSSAAPSTPRRPVARGRGRPHAAERRCRHARTAVPTGQEVAAGRGDAHHRVGGLPVGVLEEDLVDQPTGTAEQGDQTTGRRGSSLSPTLPPWTRLAAAVLAGLHDVWQVLDRRFLSEGLMTGLLATLNRPEPQVAPRPGSDQLL